MNLLIFRHGDARDQAEGGSDAARELTGTGGEQVSRAARGLGNLIQTPESILCSPKVRARQTAELIGHELGLEPQIMEVLGDGGVGEVAQAVAQRSESHLMLVGHEPTFSQLISLLIGAPVGREGAVRLKKRVALWST